MFSQDGDKVEKQTEAEFFENDIHPVYGKVEKPPTRHGVEQRFFEHIDQAAKGEGDHTSSKMGTQQKFFKPEAPVVGLA